MGPPIGRNRPSPHHEICLMPCDGGQGMGQVDARRGWAGLPPRQNSTELKMTYRFE
jgi:hypothetical protein